MSAWAKIGAKCVYIGNLGFPNEPGSEYVTEPQEGGVYTINWMGRLDHQYCLGFAELHQNGAWDIRCFRPVAYPKQSLESDVQLFTKIADRAPAPKRRVKA